MAVDVTPTEIAELGASGTPRRASEMSAAFDIPVTVTVMLGKTMMQINHLLKLGRGAAVELDQKLGEAVDIHVGGFTWGPTPPLLDRRIHRSATARE